MIKYNLTCECKCTFDSWFANSQEFERLRRNNLITCIECSSNKIKKSIMAPSVSNLKKAINCKYVGENFAQEARSIHYNNKKSEGIYGKATAEEINELHEEGIETTTVPWYHKSEN